MTSMRSRAVLCALLLLAGCSGRDRQAAGHEQRQAPVAIQAPPVALPPAPPAKPAAAAPGSKEGWYIPRSEWAQRPITMRSIDPMGRIWRITVHHSGEAPDFKDPAEDVMRRIERAHQGKDWACIGYHFVIARDGRIFEGRPLLYQGAHSTGDNNIGNIGICLLGDFDQQVPSKTQRENLIDLLDRLCRRYGIAHDKVYGHRDFRSTECPGKNLVPIVQAFRRGE